MEHTTTWIEHQSRRPAAPPSLRLPGPLRRPRRLHGELLLQVREDNGGEIEIEIVQGFIEQLIFP